MKKKGISTITVVLLSAAIIVIVGSILVSKSMSSSKRAFIQALKNEAITINKTVSKTENKVKQVKLNVKSAIELKKDVQSEQTDTIKYLNDTVFNVDFRYEEPYGNFSVVTEAQTDDSVSLENVIKVNNGKINVNFGDYTKNSKYTYTISPFVKFIEANIKLSEENKKYFSKKILDRIEKSLKITDLTSAQTTLTVDEKATKVNKIEVSVTSDRAEEILKSVIDMLKANNKYTDSMDLVLGNNITKTTDTASMLDSISVLIKAELLKYQDVIFTFYTNPETKEVLNYNLKLVAKSDSIKDKKISLNRISTEKQDLSISYMEDNDVVYAYNTKKQENNTTRLTLRAKDYELSVAYNPNDLKNTPFMFANVKNNEKVSGNISIANIEDSYLATVTVVGLLDKQVINTSFAVNVEFGTVETLDNRIDDMEERKNNTTTDIKNVVNKISKEVFKLTNKTAI